MNNRPPQDPPSLPRQYPTLEGLKIPDALKTAIRRIYQLLYDLRDEVLQRLEGMQGDPGVSGLSTSVFHYRADTTSTTASDPGAGKIRWNNSTQSSATFLYFDWLTDDKFDVTVLWQLMNAPDQFIIQDRDLAINYQIWQMTGPVVMMPDWFQIPVSFVSSSGAGVFSNNQQISVLIPATGGGGGGGGSGTVTHTGGALTADQPVFGAGSADIKVGTKTGNTNKLVSNTGTNVTGNTVKWDASGNLIDAGSAPGAGTVTSVTGTAPIASSGGATPAISIALASSSAFGAVKVDGTTITASGGVISSAGGGGSGSLVLLEQHTASGSASTLTFNAWYSSSYDEYVIKLICVVPATDGADIRLRYSSDGGSTYDATSVYDWIYVQGWINSGASGGQSALAYLTIGGNISNNATRSGVCGNITLFNPGAASYHFADYSIQYPHTSLNALASKGTVWHKNAISINAFQFFTSSGNIASGTVRVYGIAK